MTPPILPSSLTRPVVDGKFFRTGSSKFYPKGVSYGPFRPASGPDPYATPEVTARDFELIRELGANLLRVYHVPPRWFLDLAAENGLRLLVDIPWNKHLCVLDSPSLRQQTRQTVLQAVRSGAAHPAIFAWSVVNELAPDLVRWGGTRPTERFLDDLVDVAKNADPGCLCTFGSYPPTEFLQPQNLDFLCFNVYLHQKQPFENYVARLQTLADAKPLVLGEIGMDSIREGSAEQSQMLGSQVEAAFRAGLAGAIVFSFTDDWFKDGHDMEDWHFGLTTRDRQPKESFAVVKQKFEIAPYFPPPQLPKVSVVIACYNGARTLASCLKSLAALNYPDYEVLLVDDGSTDATPQIASQFPTVRQIRQEHAGLSVARNTGIAAATGEIIAFMDADCRADPDWLFYLTSDLLSGDFAGVGGHNFLPSDDSVMAAIVMASPGGPAHVMLTDRLAEHIPGCNMAFHKSALGEVGCFDPVYEKAGDDVDLCWRLQQSGCKIGFSPGGFVWHYRRSTVNGYFAQQRGYGEAEAVLARRHPERFNGFGGSVWHGCIYGGAGLSVRPPLIYRGSFASGSFQTLYRSAANGLPMVCTSLEFHLLVTLPLLVLSAPFHFFLPLALLGLGSSIGVCVTAAMQARLPRHTLHWWTRPLVALLFFLQPIVRGWARYRGRLQLGPASPRSLETLDSLAHRESDHELDQAQYWSRDGLDRLEFLAHILTRLQKRGWQYRTDAGWSDYDAEIFGSRWIAMQLATVAEYHEGGKQTLRCRLRGSWSLPSRTVFAAAVGLELVFIGLLQAGHEWIWGILLTLLVFPWWLNRERRHLKRMLATLLDKVAEESGLSKLACEES